MKKRFGFVSNSSSSSFVCSVCQEIESGMDLSLSDFDMSHCVNGHTFHNGCSKLKSKKFETFEDKKKYLIKCIETQEITSWHTEKNKQDQLAEINAFTEEDNEDDLEDWFNDEFSENGVPEESCPCCSLIEIDNDDMTAYLLKRTGLTKKQVLEEVKDKFGTYSKFSEYLKSK